QFGQQISHFMRDTALPVGRDRAYPEKSRSSTGRSRFRRPSNAEDGKRLLLRVVAGEGIFPAIQPLWVVGVHAQLINSVD
ncbi:MAG: hypothetical protein ACLFQX_10565, partial [Candidatus Kapaibacterium sp.]